MKRIILLIYCIVNFIVAYAQNNSVPRAIQFDSDWRFIKDGTIDASSPVFDDSKWRVVSVPHDWSIEDLPDQQPDKVTGPFDRNSIAKGATGFTTGGTGWYRKKFVTEKSFRNHHVSVLFDGVYMSSDVWLNGHHLGNHPYGYTAFYYEFTPYLNPPGEKNVLVVKVKNEGKNSRWYSGSGIYRHVWLIVTEPVHIDNWGVYITTPEVSTRNAIVQIKTTVNNEQRIRPKVKVITTIVSPRGKVVGKTECLLELQTDTASATTQTIKLSQPVLWSVETPDLYKAITEIRSGDKVFDRTETIFGIRSIRFDPARGFLLNGKRMILKGGCVHHDNGPLGAAAIDRAEERKIELLKNAGYNAVRLSHNPPSQQLLDACDRLGMLVIDEAFDMWEKAKNPNDYHLYFADEWQKDLDAMVLRDRNHPSVIIWSIGNEIFESADTVGHRIARELANEVHNLDKTRPVTSAIAYLPGYTKKEWELFEPFLTPLDIDGYNYFLEHESKYFTRDSATAHRFETEHAKHPGKTFLVTEYTPESALENFEYSLKHSYMLGAFKWTAMDYIGEAGIGKPQLVAASKILPSGMARMGLFYMAQWPVFNAYCGDIDLIGNKKAASYYQDVVWKRSPVEMLVHRPIPDSMQAVVAQWGFPDELKSWTWHGQEGKQIEVNVYTRSKIVKLELNGKMIAEQTIPDSSITATFRIDYQPGTLVAKSYYNGKETGSNTLTTSGKPNAIRLIADRKTIRANTNDLAYVKVDIVDEKGNVAPDVNDLDVNYKLSGNATIAAVGNGSFDDASGFRQPHKKVYQGKGLVIVRPNGLKGLVTLTATADGLKKSSIEIIIK